MITVNTAMFATLLNISESELIHALRTDNKFNGMDLPTPVSNEKGHTRRFRYDKAKAFADEIKRRTE